MFIGGLVGGGGPEILGASVEGFGAFFGEEPANPLAIEPEKLGLVVASAGGLDAV